MEPVNLQKLDTAVNELQELHHAYRRSSRITGRVLGCLQAELSQRVLDLENATVEADTQHKAALTALSDVDVLFAEVKELAHRVNTLQLVAEDLDGASAALCVALNVDAGQDKNAFMRLFR